MGAKGIWLNNEPDLGAEELDGKAQELQKDTIVLTTTDWAKIHRFLRLPARQAEVRRTTKETDIHIELNLDGTGIGDNDTGLGFL